VTLQRGQTLVMVALVLPLVLLPVMAFAVQATLLATRSSHLQAAVARAAEDATAGIDVAALRASGVIRLDATAAAAIATASLAAEDGQATVDAVVVGTITVTVRAHERVRSGFGAVLGARATTLRAAATARVTAGYASPSSRLPLPNSSLSMMG
jgi:hypothetical protein